MAECRVCLVARTRWWWPLAMKAAIVLLWFASPLLSERRAEAMVDWFVNVIAARGLVIETKPV